MSTIMIFSRIILKKKRMVPSKWSPLMINIKVLMFQHLLLFGTLLQLQVYSYKLALGMGMVTKVDLIWLWVKMLPSLFSLSQNQQRHSSTITTFKACSCCKVLPSPLLYLKFIFKQITMDVELPLLMLFSNLVCLESFLF